MANITEYHTWWWWSVLVNFFLLYSPKLLNHFWAQVVEVLKVDICQWSLVNTQQLCWDEMFWCWLDSTSINLLPPYCTYHLTEKPLMGKNPTVVTKLHDREAIPCRPLHSHPKQSEETAQPEHFQCSEAVLCYNLDSSWGWGAGTPGEAHNLVQEWSR